MSLEESDSPDDESDKLGSDSGSSGTYYYCNFSLRFDESVVGVLGSNVFAPIGVESKGGIFASDVFVTTVVELKGGQLLAIFWSSNS